MPTATSGAASESITFTNLEAEPLTTIWLRLWSNGVKGCGAHAITVAGFEGGTPGELSRRCTALPVDLDAPLAQGAEATVSMDVTIDLPARNDRFGYHGGLALLGTALPTLAIHDDLGWHLDPFVDLGESFYSIVGDYQVTLNVPADLRTPTTGTAVASETSGRRRITTYVAHDVRDFEWAAGRLATVRGRSGGTQVVVSYRRHDLTAGGRPDRARTIDPVARRLLAPASARSRIPRWTSSSRASGVRRDGVSDDHLHEPGQDHDLARARATSTGTGSSATTSSRRRGSTSRSPRGRRTCRSAAGRSARTTGSPRPTLGSRTTWATGWTHPYEYDTIYGGGGCLLANLADLFGLDRFVEILHDYAQDHWLGVTRTDDFKAAIEAAAIADGLTFDPATYWDHWRVD